MNKTQKSCNRKCRRDHVADTTYFGGKRKNTVGLKEGVCQLCGKVKEKLSSHHVLGKEHDRESDFLVALCNGCHQIVGVLASKEFTDEPDGWENLITLVMARRMRKNRPDSAGVYAYVEIDHLLGDELEEVA